MQDNREGMEGGGGRASVLPEKISGIRVGDSLALLF